MVRQAEGLRGIFLAGVFLILSPAALIANECTGHSDVPLVGMLQPPPCEACEETKAELAELNDLERARTPEEESHARQDAKRTIARFFEGAGIAFEPNSLAACEAFFAAHRKEQTAAADSAKNAFCRLRPFKTPGNTLHPIDDLKPEESFSYPSGHATWAGTVGSLLAAMMPENQAIIYGRINDYARSRMVAGVHFRSDVEAGKLFGTALANALFATPGFDREFTEAKACVRKAAGLP
jgi:acid phosphatase (class A)